ncbi:MAG: hypothetical protein M0Z53_03445 [Thermaerobacter sp.]|nr:hypothetical protein [Thermaerobacter sp.]
MVSIAANWWLFGWLIVAIWLGIMWVMAQHGRELWGRVRAIYSHPAVVEYWRKMQTGSDSCDDVTEIESPREEGDPEE